MLRLILRSAAFILAFLLLAGCGPAPSYQTEGPSSTDVSYIDTVTIEQADLEDEMRWKVFSFLLYEMAQ